MSLILKLSASFHSFGILDEFRHSPPPPPTATKNPSYPPPFLTYAYPLTSHSSFRLRVPRLASSPRPPRFQKPKTRRKSSPPPPPTNPIFSGIAVLIYLPLVLIIFFDPSPIVSRYTRAHTICLAYFLIWLPPPPPRLIAYVLLSSSPPPPPPSAYKFNIISVRAHRNSKIINRSEYTYEV